ncbi:hypothetical protein POVWA2_060780 [Plasmodium ovale wallikeri]|uniref:Uncharacterized protein n=1 Tax=Plasmodium ovale wallikeri TaxID=864142 RepID=A0A1A8YRW1_PLAOA|nr:hypothetical protein POVWA1_020870 [Plasmodium ovale wallikeri]SBT50669.1 hypothetical protein POVWA2_060780 [Plasmodium ovale wallikeri]
MLYTGSLLIRSLATSVILNVPQKGGVFLLATSVMSPPSRGGKKDTNNKKTRRTNLSPFFPAQTHVLVHKQLNKTICSINKNMDITIKRKVDRSGRR